MLYKIKLMVTLGWYWWDDIDSFSETFFINHKDSLRMTHIVCKLNLFWNDADINFRCSKQFPLYRWNEMPLILYFYFHDHIPHDSFHVWLWGVGECFSQDESVDVRIGIDLFYRNQRHSFTLRTTDKMIQQRDKMFVSIQQKTDAPPCYRKDHYHVSKNQAVLICAICYKQNASDQFVQNIMWQKKYLLLSISQLKKFNTEINRHNEIGNKQLLMLSVNCEIKSQLGWSWCCLNDTRCTIDAFLDLWSSPNKLTGWKASSKITNHDASDREKSCFWGICDKMMLHHAYFFHQSHEHAECQLAANFVTGANVSSYTLFLTDLGICGGK